MAPKITAVSRQPTALINACPRGQNTVLANPPNSVSTVMARRWWRVKARVSTANAGSYSVQAMATPSRAHAAYSCASDVTWPRPASDAAASNDPAAISARPPRRSISCPTTGASRPESSSATVNAPTTAVLLAPSADCSGSMISGNR